jgi:hypothetical protein
MKAQTLLTILTIVISLFTFSCNTKIKSQEKPENFDWLIGQWERTNEEQGKTTFENWDKISDFSYSGIGFTMQDGDTIKQEKIRLIKQNDTWDLIVKIPEETKDITFELTDFTHNSFTCINDSINFPNQIKYWTENNKLKATVSGADLNIPFEFEKIKGKKPTHNNNV